MPTILPEISKVEDFWRLHIYAAAYIVKLAISQKRCKIVSDTVSSISCR